MKFERQTIYKKYNKTPNDISYLLVLSVDKMGMTFVYFTDEKYSHLYKNIDGLYFKDLNRSVSISRTMYVGWNKVPIRYYEKYRSISNREMRKITTAMKELFDGDIVYDNEWNMCYSDEIQNRSVTPIVKDNKASESDLSQSSTVVKIADVISKDSNDIKSDEIIASDNSDITPIPESNEPTNDTNIDDSRCEKYIDLLKNIPTTDDEFRSRRSRKNKTIGNKKDIKKEHRRFFSETEALSIAHMRNIAISEKYNVDTHTAFIMKRNALEYFGMQIGTNKTTSVRNNYSQLFDAGYTLEEVIEMFPDITKTDNIKHSYSTWKAKNSECVTDYEKWFNKVIESDDLEELIKLANMKLREIIDYLKCPSHYANMISCKVRRALSRKSIFFPVFGTMVFNVDEFNTYIEYARKTYSKSNIVTIMNYETCKRLQDVYNTTFDQHQDIIIGASAIPSNISPTDVCKFISIIKRSFAKKIKLDHVPNIDAIIKNNDHMEYAINAMIKFKSTGDLNKRYNRT